MRKKRIALLLGIAALLTGLVFLLVSPFDSANPPAPALIFGSGDLVEPEDSAAHNEPLRVARENSKRAAIDPDRVFACRAYSELDAPELTIGGFKTLKNSQNHERFQAADLLTNSKDPEHLLMAALIGFDGKTKPGLSVMENALAADPDNPLTLWSFLDSCSLHPKAPKCADGSIEKRAILADGGNGRLWGKIADYRLARGDTVGALDALINANTAPQFNGYFIEHVEMLERGLAAATDNPYRERITNAIGIAAAMPQPIYKVFQGCKEQAAESAEWSQACLGYGKRLERDGRTVMSTTFGIALQKVVYKMAGDEARLADTDLRGRLITEAMESGYTDDGWVLLAYDDQVLADYMNEWSAHGEFQALQFLQEEVVRLSKQPGYDPCERRRGKSTQTPE